MIKLKYLEIFFGKILIHKILIERILELCNKLCTWGRWWDHRAGQWT